MGKTRLKTASYQSHALQSHRCGMGLFLFSPVANILQHPVKRLLFPLLFLLPLRVLALVVPEGHYFFENAVTRYSQVKFLYGASSDGVTHIISLTPQDGTLWSFDIPATADGQTHYFFADTTLPDGEYPESIATLKDRIAGERGERRTQTFKDVDNLPMVPGATFVPASADLYTTGYWMAPAETLVSGTLPTLVITTEGGKAVTSKTEYVGATAYLLPPVSGEGAADEGFCAATTMGDGEHPVELLIRGRGNYTWTGFEKKPYRLKFTEKQRIFGMPASKHFALMAGADDDLGQLRNPLGFEIARHLVHGWTPRMHPLEVVLNGRYIGLYFLSETIRIDDDRVNIAQQPDNLAEGDVTGGWLVEVDNYNTSPHISVSLPDKSQSLWVTYHSPEVLSSVQSDYLQRQFTLIRDALYKPSTASATWDELIDARTMAEVYVTRELLQDEEGFHGSFYLYKDCGEDSRWMAGPVWDFGNAYRNSLNDFTWDAPNFECFLIDRLYTFPEFQTAVREAFGRYYHTVQPTVVQYIDSLSTAIGSAAACDFRTWPSYGTDRMSEKSAEILRKLQQKTEWLAAQWGTEWDGIEALVADDGDVRVEYYDLHGRHVLTSSSVSAAKMSPVLPSGVYVRRLVRRGITLSTQRIVLSHVR